MRHNEALWVVLVALLVAQLPRAPVGLPKRAHEAPPARRERGEVWARRFTP